MTENYHILTIEHRINKKGQRYYAVTIGNDCLICETLDELTKNVVSWIHWSDGQRVIAKNEAKRRNHWQTWVKAND